MTTTWMLIDLLYMAHRARFALRGLESGDVKTGILFGFFEQLYHVCSMPIFQSNKVAVFVDSPESFRTRVFPDYKKKRASHRTEEERNQITLMYCQIDELHYDILPEIGIPVQTQEGLESDDLLAMAALYLEMIKEPGVLVTGDSDLWQAVNNYVRWFDPQRNILHDEESLLRTKGITPFQWAKVKALGGCSTDNVPGVHGIGEKGAIDFVTGKTLTNKKFNLIKNAIQSGEVQKWASLVCLPHERTKPIKLAPYEYNPDAFFRFCERYQMESYLRGSGRKKWDAFFKGHFSNIPITRRREKQGLFI